MPETKLIILLLVFSSLIITSCGDWYYEDPNYSYWEADIYTDPENIDFGDIQINQSKKEIINIYTDDYSDHKYRWEEDTIIEEISVDDTNNFSIDTTNTTMTLGWDDKTEFKVYFTPKITGDLTADITIISSRNTVKVSVKGKGIN